MTFAQSVVSCFRKSVAFEGRASRSEFWWFLLFAILFFLACTYIAPNIAIAAEITALVNSYPLLMAAMRRLHDIGRSGMWCLVWLFILTLSLFAVAITRGFVEVPSLQGSPILPFLTLISLLIALIGTIVLVVWWMLAGDAGENKYGAAPRRDAIPVAIKRLLIQAKVNLYDLDEIARREGETVLMEAACDGRTHIVRALIQAGATINTASEKDGDTALIKASRHGHTEIVRALIQAGANPNKASEKDGDTALTKASCYGYTEVVQLLRDAGAKE